jgi:hypothetical protein
MVRARRSITTRPSDVQDTTASSSIAPWPEETDDDPGETGSELLREVCVADSWLGGLAPAAAALEDSACGVTFVREEPEPELL